MEFSAVGTLRQVAVTPHKDWDGKPVAVAQIVIECDPTERLGALAMFVGQPIEAVIVPQQMALGEDTGKPMLGMVR